MNKSTRRRQKLNFNNFIHKNNLLYNLVIIFLSLVIIGFIYSFFDSYNQDDKITYNNSKNLQDLLIINDYEKKTGHRIRVEILNGCGALGLADKYSNLFRKNGFDVISSKNALNFNYKESQVIIRRGDKEFAIESAELMGIHANKIIEDYNKLLDCDVTIILGKDYNKLTSFIKAIEMSPPF